MIYKQSLISKLTLMLNNKYNINSVECYYYHSLILMIYYPLL
jgi:hypothetical protein